MKRTLDVADLFRSYGAAYRHEHAHGLPLRHLRAMRAIEICRTAELGGHVDECDHCGALRISYNSCRNRHCPKCQCLDKERWLEAQKRDVLPIQYFHVVFTLPQALRPLALRNQKVIYNLFFRAVSETIKELCEDPKHLGAEPGFIALLHTWSQTLLDHPHIHCIVTGGGLSRDGDQWVPCKKTFFIPVKVLSAVFRGKFLDYLKKGYEKKVLTFSGAVAHLAEEKAFTGMMNKLYDQDWVVYCKLPFKNAETVIDYLGRYTHRVAISNERIVNLNDNRVTISYRDSADHDQIKRLTLDAFEFIRRFLLHILPDGFMKIRHYGLLSNRNRKTKLKRCRELLGASTNPDQKKDGEEAWEDVFYRVTGIDLRICPCCGKGRMVLRETLLPTCGRNPP
jgi:hypothetical protein